MIRSKSAAVLTSCTCAAVGIAGGEVEDSTSLDDICRCLSPLSGTIARAAVGAVSSMLALALALALVLGSHGSTRGGASSGSKSSCACKGM